MRRKPDPQDHPNDAARGVKSCQSSSQRSITKSLPPDQPGPADEWIITQVGGIVERLGRVIVLGARGHRLRHLTIDEVLSYCAARPAASQTPGNLARGDMAVWKGARLHAYVQVGAAGSSKVHKIK
jgi:hypothetical protein